jgi:hypothetical protein
MTNMQSPPPKNARTIGPGEISATRHAVSKFVKKRARGLCKGRIGWWGEQAVEAAIWLYLENHIASILDDDLEGDIGDFLVTKEE